MKEVQLKGINSQFLKNVSRGITSGWKFFFFNIYLFIWLHQVMACDLTRDGTWAAYIGNMKSQPLNHLASSIY